MTDDPMILHDEPKPQRELPKAGMHPAVCYLVAYMGEDVQEGMKDEKTGKMKPDKIVKKIRLFFELAQKLTSGDFAGEQMVQSSSSITLSTFEQANLHKLLKGWLGMDPKEMEGFDIRGLVGKQALLNIAHQRNKAGTNTYAKIVSINPPMDGQPEVKITASGEPKWLQKDRDEMLARVTAFLRNKGGGKPAAAGEREPGDDTGFDEVPY